MGGVLQRPFDDQSWVIPAWNVTVVERFAGRASFAAQMVVLFNVLRLKFYLRVL